MKKIVCLFCLFSVLISCKQTLLTSNYNKKSNKIYNKTPLKYKDFDVVSIEKRASAPAKSSPIRKSTENQFCSNEVTNKDELLTYLETSEINEVSLDNHLHKRTLRLDSILKSNLKSNSDNKILDFSKKAKKYSLIAISVFLKEYSRYQMICASLFIQAPLGDLNDLYGNLFIIFKIQKILNFF